jgi:hypothetical protein
MLGVPAFILQSACRPQIPPALVGGVLAYAIDKRASRTGRRSMRERGIVIASGLMAGGALGGVIGAALHLVPGYSEDWVKTPFYENDSISQPVSIIGFALFVAYVWWMSQRTPKAESR